MLPWLVALALAQSAPLPAPSHDNPPPPTAKDDSARASKDDEELLKDLALLERLDLVRNLELFEDEKDAPPPPPEKAQ